MPVLTGRSRNARALGLASVLVLGGAPPLALAGPPSGGPPQNTSEPPAEKKPGATPDGATAPDAAAADKPVKTEWWAFHAQSTLVTQYHPKFDSAYRGANSLDPGSRADETTDLTGYAGIAPWKGAELWIDPEVDQGFGLSNTLGIEGFPSAEGYKVGHSYPYPKVHRLFLRQTLGLGGGQEKVDPDLNQLGGVRDANRLVFTVGKLGVVDIFDNNKFAHDARNDFLNWSLVDTATYDYAADAWGYSYGVALEWYQGPWTLRGGLFDLSGIPNNKNLDKGFHQFQYDAEVERRFTLAGRPGAVRVTGFLTRGRMARLSDAVTLAEQTGAAPDLALVRHYRSRPGLSVNLDQQVTADLGVFARAGFADDRYEGYEFTDIDRTVALGLSLKGTRWNRGADAIGVGGVANDIDKPKQSYFNAGGLGILAGDGRLPHPGTERIVEAYYSWAALPFTHVTLDYQYVVNPAFNRDRGPVQVIGLRLHLQR